MQPALSDFRQFQRLPRRGPKKAFNKCLGVCKSSETTDSTTLLSGTSLWVSQWLISGPLSQVDIDLSVDSSPSMFDIWLAVQLICAVYQVFL